MRILFTLTLFLSSALLFLIQPMVGKIILPAFGGSPAVWTTTMVFFQATLLAGYAYAHFSTSRLGVRRQALIHIPLMCVALITLPFATHAADGATGERSPFLVVIGALAALVGVVFFVVSAGAPLLQRWFAATDDPAAKDPYFLYSASNLGSMLSLLAYPVLVEPRFKLSEQTRLWMYGYAALILCMIASAIALYTRGAVKQSSQEAEAPIEPVRPKQRAMWVLLAAVPSSLLLGVTAYLTSNITPVPLLWVVPLAIYLLTFTLAFARRTVLKSSALARVLPLIVTPLAIAVILESSAPIFLLALLHLIAFFVAAWMCHARLSESRPNAKHLTEFYLWISVGGVLGGLFNAAIAPLIFTTLLEYPLALVLACALRPPRRPEDLSPRSWDGYYPVIVGFLTIALTLIVRLAQVPAGPMRTMLAIGLPATLCFLAVDRPIRYALSMGAMFAAAFGMHTSADGTVLYTARSFFGVHRVLSRPNPAGDRQFALVHGTTTHGIQDREHPLEPLTYYTRSGPIGHVFAAFSGKEAKKHIAFVGLGIGSVAAYGEPGETMTFFEIDPVVRAIATNPKFFTYIHDSKAKVDIVLGDARLTLAQQPDGRFGLIVLDAFSSDAIPIHLLTEEAFQLYLSKLAPHGIIAVHISNRYLELDSVIDALANALHLSARIDKDVKTQDEQDAGMLPSEWVVLARDKADLGGLNTDVEFQALDPQFKTKVWTDDFSNIFSVFKRDPD